MIQVIQRVFQILERLNADEGTGLSQLALATNLNKGTLCNILKTLTDLGYVAKSGNGSYLVSRKFFQLAYPFHQKEKLVELAGRFSNILAEQTMESGVVTTLCGDKVRIVAQAQYSRSLMVNPEVYKDLSLFHSVSGRALLSFLDDGRLREIVATAGFPGAEWDGIKDFAGLAEAAGKVRSEGMSVMENQGWEIKAFAVPVLDAEGKVCAALGLTVPSHRLAGGNEGKIVAALRGGAELMAAALAVESTHQRDWFKLFQ